MIFKKKRMVDVRELQRKGLISPTHYENNLTSNKEGFIDFSKKEEKNPITIETQRNSQIETPSSVFGFFESSKSESFSTDSEGYNKREVDTKIQNLDNKIYKMEQRIELLERKIGIQNNSGNTSGTGLW